MLFSTSRATPPWHSIHRQTDRQTERANQEIEKYLRLFVNYAQNDWAEWLALAEFTHNNWVHSATGKTLFEVNCGFHPDIIPNACPRAVLGTPTSLEFVLKMQKVHQEAKKVLEKVATQMKAQYDKHKKPTVDYQISNKVWLDTTNLHLPHPKKKLDDKWTGPFKITAKKGTSAYTLELPMQWRIHPMFNEALLTLYATPAFPNQEQPPPPVPELINGLEYFKVKKVLDSRTRTVCSKWGEPPHVITNYFIKWKNEGPKSNSWVREDLMDMPDALEQFLNERVDLIVTDCPQATVIIDIEPVEWEGLPAIWKYLVKPTDDPIHSSTAETWYYEHEIPQYSALINQYWQKNYKDSFKEPNGGEFY